VIRAALDARMRGTGDVAGAGNFLSVVRDEIDRP
jgi:hypothetical protein